MIKTIISHDVENAIAVIRFEHMDVTYQDTFDLKLVIPSSERIFEELGMPFDAEVQGRVIDRLEVVITSQIESGAIRNPPPEGDGSLGPLPEAPPMEEEDDGTTNGGNLSEPSEHGTGPSGEPSDQPE